MDEDDAAGCLVGIFYLLCIIAWINHVIVCVREDHYVLLFVGIFLPPVGVVHGAGAFFGWW